MTSFLFRRLHVLAVFAACAAISAGCGRSSSFSPTAPTPAPPPALAAPGEKWNLVMTFTSFVGPEGCVSAAVHQQLGQAASLPMEIQRSGDSVHLTLFDPEEPSYRGYYDGTIADGVLTMRTLDRSGRTTCDGRSMDYVSSGVVTGRFSSGDSVLVAEHVSTERFPSGETLEFHYDWKANRQ